MQEISIGALKIAFGATVNDVHSQLNRTWVQEVVSITCLGQIQSVLKRAAAQGSSVSIAGGRHAMGAQQFGQATILLDMTGYNRVLEFDSGAGTVTVESGIQWPDLIDFLVKAQPDASWQWGIIQKQTGADHLTIGGALAANIHGRGLNLRPFIQDVESFVLIDACGNARLVSRKQNADLFRLAVGGYGLFGVVGPVTLRLTRRRKLLRAVEITHIDGLVPAFDKRVGDGHLYGDFQFSIDETSEDFLTKGVISTYLPVDESTPVPAVQRRLSADEWNSLVQLAHSDRRKAFKQYCDHYLATSGQIYWSDTHQLSTYLDGYHQRLNGAGSELKSGTEIITEIYVPRSRLAEFMRAAGLYLRNNGLAVIYGTIRLIERDDESFLAWAKERFACIIFNLHTEHSANGVSRSARAFRHLIDLAIERGGSFYLTYHRFATREQVIACYPQFEQFLQLKSQHDPRGVFESDWYRHYRLQVAAERSSAAKDL